MSLESIVEAFGRGLGQGITGYEAKKPVAPDGYRPTGAATGRGRRRNARDLHSEQAPAPVPPAAAPEEPVQIDMFQTPPVVTQAQLEYMERMLRGEQPKDTYVPGEGQAAAWGAGGATIPGTE